MTALNTLSSLQRGLKLPIARVVARATISDLDTACSSLGSGIYTSCYTTSGRGQVNARQIHTSSHLHQAKKPQKDLFTPSPFSRFDKFNVSSKFAIHRVLKEGDDAYGIRRYLLVPRTEDDVRDYDTSQGGEPHPSQVIASLNANKNVLFGAQLHTTSSSDDERISQYLMACGFLLDIAREDAASNGQQVQALATLNGLCSWVSECFDNDGVGSDVLTSLIHGDQQPNNQHDTTEGKKDKKLPRSGKRAKQQIQNTAAKLILKNEVERIQMCDAIRAIATGTPRPGHSVVGAGTYRDGKKGWMALAKEYTDLATTDAAITLDASYVGKVGLEEVALYKSRDGELVGIEHLAHTQPEYLREAGGAMARMFFA